jgi:YD repeat-containing protein
MVEQQVADQHETILAGLAGERAHSRISEANGRPVQWTYDANGSMAAVRTPGQLAYERDLERQPTYHIADHGTDAPRPAWHELSDIARWSWEQNPTDRF